MARPRQPIELIQAKGKKHLTKSEIEQRKETEVKANSDNIVAPSHLTKLQKKKFDYISRELIKVGIMSNLDCDVLARYLVAESLYLKLSETLNQDEIQADIFKFEKISALQDKYFKQCQSCASSLGLTISSRCKLSVPKIEKEETSDPMEEMLNRRMLG